MTAMSLVWDFVQGKGPVGLRSDGDLVIGGPSNRLQIYSPNNEYLQYLLRCKYKHPTSNHAMDAED